MGMFNWVDFVCNCPLCDSEVIGFQTKEGDLILDTVEFESVNNFYSGCDDCGTWVEFDRNCKHEKFKMIKPEKEVIDTIKNKIKTKNDALLYSQDENELIRNYARKILKGKTCI